MVETELKTALERAATGKGVLMLYGPALKPAAAAQALEKAYGKKAVRTLDCTEAPVPDLAALDRLFSDGLKPGNIFQVAVDRHIPPALWDALVSVAATNRLPSGTALPPKRGVLVFSARIKWLSELNEDVRECFPVSVGDFS